ncbi:hypothetical protein EVAR_76657_1 [Eumeta japonica]|uniref:Uncharacterized protein n=1 Tax=Eumeta variegata TaxID=151549 RepID=A0A4C1SBF8_EUMVA|nr:hypothetical protein EVAR_76657_1 [Eumeta japonica]
MQEFEIGDSVYVENGNRLNRKKLDELKIGPFKIIEKISNSIYKIDTGNTKTESTLFHITKLHPVTAEDEVEENEYEDNLYKEGLLIDYAIKKERLLLDVNKSMDSKTMIDLIATGLPGFILQKLNRDELNDTTDLFNEIRKYEGSQISLINSRLIKVKEKKDNVNIAYMKTVNGVKKTDGLITIKVKIFDLEEEVDVHIVENEDFDDFIIGLDMIKKFKLTQNEDLQIEQKKITNKIDRMSKDSINEEKNIKHLQ